MDWTLAIDRNREALKRILGTLAAMAGFGSPSAGAGPAAAGSSRPLDAFRHATGMTDFGQSPKPASLPRHLHRAILRLLRPAESAARRLIIVAARGLVVTLPPARAQRQKPKPMPTLLRKPRGNGIFVRTTTLPRTRPAPRFISLPLLDPAIRPFRRRQPTQLCVPRISSPGFGATLSPIRLRLPLTPDDPLDATRLTLRLKALATALDDLPAQAQRFARWKARRDTAKTVPIQNTCRPRLIWPLRPGRPPGGRRRPTHEIHDILTDLHGLAFDVLERRDTS